jgi:hypothetical protein
MTGADIASSPSEGEMPEAREAQTFPVSEGFRPDPGESPEARRPEDHREGGNDSLPLFSAAETQKFTDEWRAVQAEFVDHPRDAVEEADRMVADLMQRLASQFTETRSSLEQQWDGQEDISTEDLRVAMTRYRSFFERLLAA